MGLVISLNPLSKIKSDHFSVLQFPCHPTWPPAATVRALKRLRRAWSVRGPTAELRHLGKACKCRKARWMMRPASLKLTGIAAETPLKVGHPNFGNDRIPTIHFSGANCLLVSGRVNDSFKRKGKWSEVKDAKWEMDLTFDPFALKCLIRRQFSSDVPNTRIYTVHVYTFCATNVATGPGASSMTSLAFSSPGDHGKSSESHWPSFQGDKTMSK